MRCVIMQPTYLPWIGYFDLIEQSDVFLFLDTVQFEKQSWQQRNRIKTAQGVTWLTVPAEQNLSHTVREVRINRRTDWQRKHWLTIEQSYRKSCYFARYAPQLHGFYTSEWETLADLNLALIQTLSRCLGLQPHFLRTSEMAPVCGEKADKLVALCRQVGAVEYLSPPGARDYLTDATPFADAGIALRFHHYQHPEYPQRYGDFVPYLSLLDLLFQCGEESLSILRSGRRDSLMP